jgi:hypothetical protein
MLVVQMFHVLPGPLQDRVFHALAISGKQEGQSINMQLPIDYSSFVTVGTIRARSRLEPQGNAFMRTESPSLPSYSGREAVRRSLKVFMRPWNAFVSSQAQRRSIRSGT